MRRLNCCGNETEGVSAAVNRASTLRTRLLHRLAAQEGFALVLALGIMIALGAVGTTLTVYSTQNYHSTARSQADQTALALAEAGLNNAYSTLFSASNPSMAGAVPQQTVTLEGGTVTYYGTLNGTTWTLTGVGRARNPTGASDVVRVVSGRARLGTATRGTANNAVWNYVYADDVGTCTTLDNNVNVNTPLYVRGNLCLKNSARVTGYTLQVGGTVTLDNSSTIGTAGTPLPEAHIGGGCRLGVGPLHSPCGPADRVFATVVDSQPAGLVKPPIDLAGWYQNAMPGPMHNCTSGSFPGGFDNDTTMNRSLGTVDLTPSFAYDCQVRDASGNLLGQIAWTPGTGTLIVSGTIFFDGNVSFANFVNVVYQGRGTIYASGTMKLGNHSTLCGVAGCGSNWDPSQNLLALVAGSSTDPVGFSIENNSTFQGAVYAVNDYEEENNATVWGPIIARQVHLENSTTNFYVPIGTLLPGMPSSTETILTVLSEAGSFG